MIVGDNNGDDEGIRGSAVGQGCWVGDLTVGTHAAALADGGTVGAANGIGIGQYKTAAEKEDERNSENSWKREAASYG